MPADLNWFAVLAHHAARTPDKAMTVFEGATTTYGDMAARATALAGGLAARLPGWRAFCCWRCARSSTGTCS